MFKLHLTGARGPNGKVPTAEVEVPVLPTTGDHVSHDPTGISGTVRSVGFWWDDKGKLTVEVQVR